MTFELGFDIIQFNEKIDWCGGNKKPPLCLCGLLNFEKR